MNKIVMFLLTLVMALGIISGSWGAVSTYSFTQTSGTYTSVSGTQLLGIVDDAVSSLTNIGFDFTYDGNVYTQFYASSNGFIRLGNTAPSSTTYTPISANISNTIAAGALDGWIRGSCQTTLSGSSGSYIRIIQYTNYRARANDNNNSNYLMTFQIRLYQTTNVIEIIYGGAAPGGTTQEALQVGIRSSTTASDYSNRTGTNWAASTAGTTSTATMAFRDTMYPASGQTYRWTPPSSVVNPTSFTATAISTSQIDLSWVRNATPDNVMVAFNTTNTFGTPVPGTTYSVGNTIPGGGTVIYNGSGTSYSHTSLTPETTYYYRAWSVSGTTQYSTGVNANATTLSNKVTVTVGTGTATTNNLPARTDYDWSYSQQIYTRAQINQSGAIEKILLYFSSGLTTNSRCWFIYMGHTTKTTFSSATDWVPLANLTRVFDGAITAPVAGAWHEITLTTPFQYDNVNNLVVAIDENYYGVAGTRGVWGSFTSGTNTGIYKHVDTTTAYENDINPTAPGTATGRTADINRIQFVFEPSFLVTPLSVTRLAYINRTLSSDLSIKNIGSTNLTISSITGTASWLSYSFTPPATVTPGSSYVLPLNFTAPGTAGTNTMNLSITTSAGIITVPVGLKVISTAIPTNPRHVAQWENARGALICWASGTNGSPSGLGIPDNLILDLANNAPNLYCVVSTGNYTTAYNYFQNTIGITPMSKVVFIQTPNDSYWSRDWGPISVYEDDGTGGRRLAMINFDYNRDNRTNDENITPNVATALGIPYYNIAMSLTGGNILTDGLYQEFANDEVYYQNDGDTTTGQMNNFTEAYSYTWSEFSDLVPLYRGTLWNNGFHAMIDPLKDYIHHIDTWAKLISIDRVIIADGKPDAEVDAALDLLAAQWATWTASNGNLFTVYRVQEPANQPYTNAFIMNKRAYIPFMGGTSAAADNAALAVWQAALDAAYGTNVYIAAGYTARTGAAWVATDAIHCRVHTIFAVDEEPPLPVELSSFTVVTSVTNQAMLTWVTQTETNVAGFNIYRGTSNELAEAVQLNAFIEATNTSQQQTYIYVDEEIWQSGTYYYWLESRDLDGTNNFYGPVSITLQPNDQQTPPVALVTGIDGVFPNPFNPSTTIAYTVSETSDVEILIYNVKGQLVRELLRMSKQPGNHRELWDGLDKNGSPCASGLYNVVLRAGNKTFNRKAVLLK